MKLFPNSFNRIFIALASVFVIAGCGSAEKLVSTWRAEQIQIDGKNQDWQGSLQSFPKEQYSVGFKNDDKFLYICFITSDREKINRIMSAGLNVVFNSPQNDKRDYTITFPVVSPGSMQGAPNGQQGERGQMQKPPEGMQAPGERTPKGGNNTMLLQILDRQINFNLIEKDFTNSISLKNNENIELKMGLDKDLLVYEMKIPLENTKSSFPIWALPGEKINVTIETVQMKQAMKGMPEGGRGGMQGGDDMGGVDMTASGDGNMGGPGGPGGRGRMGGRGGMQQAASKSSDKFTAEFSITLSSGK